MIPAHAVAQHHVEGRGGAAFFLVALDGDSIQILPPERKALNLVRVAMIVKMYSAIGCEEAVEFLDGMRVYSLGLQDHEVSDVDDPDTQRWAYAAEDGSRDDHFEHQLRAGSDEDYVRIEASLAIQGDPLDDQKPLRRSKDVSFLKWRGRQLPADEEDVVYICEAQVSSAVAGSDNLT